MKIKLLATLFAISITCLFLFNKKTIQNGALEIILPQPTEIGLPPSKEDAARDEDESQTQREEWLERMHRSKDDINWKSIESQTRYTRHLERTEKRKSGTLRGGDEEVLANEQLKGSWCERGSNNQAGRVILTEYDQDADIIWLISQGGTLFKGPRDGSAWEVVNQDLRFSGGILKFIPTSSGRRLFTFIDDLPHYSDDDGLSWTPSLGVSHDDDTGRYFSPVVLSDSLNRIYFLDKKVYNADIQLYRSNDQGESFEAIQTFNMSNFRRLNLCSPHHSDEIYMLQRPNNAQVHLIQINKENDLLDTLSTSSFSIGNGDRTNLAGTMTDTSTLFYAYDGNEVLHTTHDFGQTWEVRDTLPARPWNVGVYVLPSNPNIIYMGEVELYLSGNGGMEWFKVNHWGAYYGNVLHRLHADMMNLAEFQTSTGEDFLLVSNDGGLSVSYEYGNFDNGYTNIALEGLNVSQYYDVVSDPNEDHPYIYAGSQDQGFQRAFTFLSGDEEPLEFDQIISGDYGHITFSKNNSRMWMVYPGGWITYYANHNNDTSPTFAYELISEDEALWIPPLMKSPIPSEDVVYLAGGNSEGGDGSFIIKLQIQNGAIVPENLPFDFKIASGGEVSAMSTSPLNPEKWFVATDNGRFYYSQDAGQTWQESMVEVPDAQYLYGNTIYPSKFDEGVIYAGGSGYSNPAVVKSSDGGITFSDLSEGLPQTLVYELTANADESMLFAATEAGPYVFIVDEEKWYDMSGLNAPAQTYWSVEYLEQFNLVRFGTYGRGIWDFRIKEEVAIENLSESNRGRVFPNPTSSFIEVELNSFEGKNANVLLFDVSGKLIFEKSISLLGNNITKEQFNLSNLQSGVYFLKIENEFGSFFEKIIKE